MKKVLLHLSLALLTLFFCLAASLFDIDPATVNHAAYLSALSAMSESRRTAYFETVNAKINALRAEPLPHR